LDSSAVGIVQLVHAAGESILCREGWRRGSFQATLGGLVAVMTHDAVLILLLSVHGYMHIITSFVTL